jgi:hypothetical protein
MPPCLPLHNKPVSSQGEIHVPIGQTLTLGTAGYDPAGFPTLQPYDYSVTSPMVAWMGQGR